MASSGDKKSKYKKAPIKAWAESKTGGFEATCIRLPEGVGFWKPTEEKVYKLDVIPYLVGKVNKAADEGYIYPLLTYTVHRGLGLEGKSTYVCNAKTFERDKARCKCYVCHWLAHQGGSADPELVKNLKKKDRVLMNVLDVTDSVSKEKGIQILDQPFGGPKNPYFGQILKDKIATLEEYQDFFDLAAGYTLHCKVVKDSFEGSSFMKVVNIEMTPRKYKYPESMVEEALVLDDILIYTSPKEMKAIFHQTEDDGTGDEEDTGRDETGGGDDEQEEEEAPRRTQAKKAGKPAPPSDDDEEPEETEDDDTDTEDEPPARKGKSAPAKNDKAKKTVEETTAEDAGIEVGDTVEHPEFGVCQVVKISGDGTSLTLEDADEDLHKAVGPEEVTKVEADEDQGEEEEPEDEPEEEEETAPPKKKPAPAAGKKPAKKEPEPEADEDNDDFWGDDEDEPAPPKGRR